jgi:hypothetical protein
LATNDRAIPLNLEMTMAKRIKADTITLASSYVVMLPQPDKVVTFIIRAAQYSAREARNNLERSR